MNVTIFEKKKIDFETCVLFLSTTFVWNISRSMKNWTRYDQKCILVFMDSTSYSCQILMKFGFSKSTQLSNFMEVRLVGVELVRVDRQTRRS
jgi:hypothetical protein